MNEAQQPSIRFDTPATAASAQCAACRKAITSTYFAVGDQTVCESCKDGLVQTLSGSAGVGGFVQALLLGSLGGLIGAAVWYGIRAMTGYELGIIAIAIGYLVGFAVKRASGGRGGLGFQILAVLLTYLWIAMNYVPDIYANYAAAESMSAAMKVVVSVVTALALPFLMGFENAIGILIIGFGLYTAWSANKRVQLNVTGPFTLAPAQTTAANG